MVEARGLAQKPLSSKQLERYFDGEDIFVERENIFRGFLKIRNSVDFIV